MEVVGQRDDRHPGVRHDPGGMLALVGLTVQVGHAARVTGREPLIELVAMRAPLEARDADCIEPQLEPPTFKRDGSARRLRVTMLLDAFFHKCIVSRRHLANRTTSSSGGVASASPYAVNMRQRTYSRGGSGRNGARRDQSRARGLQARGSEERRVGEEGGTRGAPDA